jgi:hypothetical protein
VSRAINVALCTLGRHSHRSCNLRRRPCRQPRRQSSSQIFRRLDRSRGNRPWGKRKSDLSSQTTPRHGPRAGERGEPTSWVLMNRTARATQMGRCSERQMFTPEGRCEGAPLWHPRCTCRDFGDLRATLKRKLARRNAIRQMSGAAVTVFLAATTQLAEIGRAGNGWCTYGTCTETGATVTWAHGQGALVRGCPGTVARRRVLGRGRTTEQSDPDYTEQLFIDIEDKDRSA